MKSLRNKTESTRSLGQNGGFSEQDVNTGNSVYKTAALHMTARFGVQLQNSHKGWTLSHKFSKFTVQ